MYLRVCIVKFSLLLVVLFLVRKLLCKNPVSYTHLDVYKRQTLDVSRTTPGQE